MLEMGRNSSRTMAMPAQNVNVDGKLMASVMMSMMIEPRFIASAINTGSSESLW